MASLLVHRGPDGFSSWNEGPVGFAARILRTSPAELGQEPTLVARDGLGTVVADARIDNREELLHELDVRKRPEEVTDAELILAAYRTWGKTTPERLIGDFAFAIWDPGQRTLFCARDAFGARPFYYHLTDRHLIFASEVKALFSLPDVPRELDEVQLAFFLDDFLDDPERTFYRNIRRLPAAHSLEVSVDGQRTRRYWSTDPSREVRYASGEQYAEAFREIFLQAVQSRLRNAVPVAVGLSGGLDSSSITCAARRVVPENRPVHAFAGVFPGLPEEGRASNDESEYIDAVGRTPGIVLHRVPADQSTPLAGYDRVLWHLDAPPLGFNLYMNLALYDAARREGARIFLDGTDGDSVVSHGYERFIDLANEGQWSTAIEEVSALTARTEAPRGWFPRSLLYPQLVRLARSGRWRSWWRGSTVISKRLHRSRTALLLRYGIVPLLPRWVQKSALGRGSSAAHPGYLIREEFARRTHVWEREQDLRLYDSPAASAREDHARVLSLPRYQAGLELIDGVAASYGIEVRYPFFDRRLVEFCVAVPPDQKLADGWTRLILRRAMENILPPAVQWRVHKGNLGFTFVTGMREIEAPRLEAALFDDPSILEEFVDMKVLRSTHRSLTSPSPSPAVGAEAMMVYKAAVLARWLENHGRDARGGQR